MRFIIADEFYNQLVEQAYPTPDCYVRPGELNFILGQFGVNVMVDHF